MRPSTPRYGYIKLSWAEGRRPYMGTTDFWKVDGILVPHMGRPIPVALHTSDIRKGFSETPTALTNTSFIKSNNTVTPH